MQYEDPFRARLNAFAGPLAVKGLLKSCVTGFGQKYTLYATHVGNRGDAKYELWMVTANSRNVEVLSKPMKLSIMSMDKKQILSQMDECERHFASVPPPGLSHAPLCCVIPVDSELISFSLVDLFNDTERLLPGDEVFVANHLPDDLIWYHSGIHIGGGFFCHFVPKNGFNQTDFEHGRTVPGEVECVTTLGFYAAVPSEIGRTAFRVTHPILVREGSTIVDQAKRFIDDKIFKDYSYAKRNCQHFSSLCSYDREFSYNSDTLYSSKKQPPLHKVAALTPTVRQSSVAKESCVDSLVKGMRLQVNLGNYVDEPQKVGGPMTKFEQKPNVVSKKVPTFAMDDGEYFCM